MIGQRKLAVVALMFAAAVAVACEAETGPGAPDRTNGCIDLSCGPSGSSASSSGDSGTATDGG